MYVKSIIWAIICIPVFVSTSFGQDLFFPADQFDKFGSEWNESSENVRLESLMTERARYEPVREYSPSDPIRKIAKSTGKLKVLLATQGTSCTASIIDSLHIITNYHCVPGKPNRTERYGPVREVKLALGYIDDDDLLEAEMLSFEISPVESSKELDFSILKATRPIDVDRWGTTILSDEVPGPAQSLLIVHHPMGIPQQVTRSSCRSNSPVALQGNRLIHVCDTQGGSSGAPIFTNGNSMVALHHSGGVSDVVRNYATPVFAIAEKSRIVRKLLNTNSSVTDSPEVSPTDKLTSFPEVNAEVGVTGNDSGEKVWLAIANSIDPKPFQEFVINYPSSQFNNLAKIKLSNLEEFLWEKAVSINTKESYKKFIGNFPNSVYTQIALKRSR